MDTVYYAVHRWTHPKGKNDENEWMCYLQKCSQGVVKRLRLAAWGDHPHLSDKRVSLVRTDDSQVRRKGGGGEEIKSQDSAPVRAEADN